MSSIWDVINSINFTKEAVPEAESLYTPFIVNRALSYFPDSVLYANEMNGYADIDKDMQYQYYLHVIRKRKRFSKWGKKSEDSSLDIIIEYYSCNRRRAEEYKKLLSADQIADMRLHLSKGGY